MFSRFFLLTILHLIFQISITGAAATFYKTRKMKLSFSSLLILLFLFIGLLFGLEFTTIPIVIRFIMFCVFSIINGVLVSNYLENTNADDIKKTIIYTTTIFIMMVFLGIILFKLKTNIQPLIFFIMVYSIAMLFLSIYTLFLSEKNPIQKYRRLGFIALFSLYIVIDTYFNMNRDFDNDLVRSTIAYYTDILGIFRNIQALEE